MKKFILPSVSALIFLLGFGLGFGDDLAPESPKSPSGLVGIQRIKPGELQALISIHTTPTGDLIVLGKDAKGITLLRIEPNGHQLNSFTFAPDQTPPDHSPYRYVALGDAEGNCYLSYAGDSTVWIIEPGGNAKSFDTKIPLQALSLAKLGNDEYLYLIGSNATAARLHLPDMTSTPLILSDYPKNGVLSDLHVRANGELYAYSPEALIWHFSPAGKLIDKIGGGGQQPPHIGLPADYMTRFFDVADNGDIYWTAGDYGAVEKLTADGKTGVRYSGWEAFGKPWTPPFYQMAGLAISGDHAFVMGGSLMTAFPLSAVDAGAKDTSSVDAYVFGFQYNLTSDTPYKLFTSDSAKLNVVFSPGNRRVHHVVLAYEIRDIGRNLIIKGDVPLDVPGNGEATFPLPSISLPQMGWYRVDTSLYTEDHSLLSERVHFISRTFTDPDLPIPAKEVSGWNDIDTPKMVGMQLMRLGDNNFSQIESALASIPRAEELKMPYFCLLTNKPDCTPENTKAVLSKHPEIPLFEVMNEPDQQGVSPEDYVEKYLKPCFEEAHRVSPDIKVMGPSKCGIELGWMARFFKAGGGQYVDAISVHTYERNDSMDFYHWNWKLAKLKQMMADNGCGDKPLYVTEHGYMGDFHGFILRPEWQAWSVFDEYLALDRVGVSPDHYSYYYVNQGGQADFSSYLVDDARELYPAALLMRARAHLLRGTQFASPLDFGDPGNWLIEANRYNGTDKDVVILVNAGTFRPVNVSVHLPSGANVYDCWGNPVAIAPDTATLPIDRYPTYVVVPHGSAVAASLPPWGENIAPDAQIQVEPKPLTSPSLLTNGLLEFDFADEPERKGMYAPDGKLPVDVTLHWPQAHQISSVILYGNLADNQYCSPLDYDLQERVDGEWKTIEEVRVPTEGKNLKNGNIARITSYPDPWIFVHQFKPVVTDGIRFHFTRTTYGQYPTAEISDNLSASYGWGPILPAVQLREVQVFSTTH